MCLNSLAKSRYVHKRKHPHTRYPHHTIHTITLSKEPFFYVFVKHVPLQEHGAVVAGGLFPEIKYFRIGHMAHSVTCAEKGHLSKTLKAVRAALVDCGHHKHNLEKIEVPNKL